MAYLQPELVSLVIATVTLWQVHGPVSQVTMPSSSFPIETSSCRWIQLSNKVQEEVLRCVNTYSYKVLLQTLQLWLFSQNGMANLKIQNNC